MCIWSGHCVCCRRWTSLDPSSKQTSLSPVIRCSLLWPLILFRSYRSKSWLQRWQLRRCLRENPKLYSWAEWERCLSSEEVSEKTENLEGFFLCREDWELLIEDTVTSKGRNFHLLLLWVQLQSLAVVIPFQICKLSRSSGTYIWAIGVPPLPFFLLYTAPQSNLILWKVVSRKVWGGRT